MITIRWKIVEKALSTDIPVTVHQEDWPKFRLSACQSIFFPHIFYLKLYPSLDHTDFSRFDHHPKLCQYQLLTSFADMRHSLAEFCLDIQAALLRTNQHLSIPITKRLVVHRSIGKIHVDSQSLTQICISISRDCLQSFQEIDLIFVWRELERVPSQLRSTDVHFRVHRQEGWL